MSHVTGFGGVFFKSKNPEAIRDWYVEHLGLPKSPDGFVVFRWREGGDGEEPGSMASTVWSPFPADTTYFEPSPAPFMINFRVRDLDAALADLRAKGVWVDERIEDSELGRFGWILDPDGNRIELWQPPEGY
ncbi:MAG: VOC family protein [Deltaproteobacteria bacterium]|nr:VOC family protein [Deltaproteobacteria bacterium]